MNDIKIVIDTRNENSVNATIYMVNSKSGSSNTGTIWMTNDEFDMFTNTIAMGLPDECQLIVDDATSDKYFDD